MLSIDKIPCPFIWILFFWGLGGVRGFSLSVESYKVFYCCLNVCTTYFELECILPCIIHYSF